MPHINSNREKKLMRLLRLHSSTEERSEWYLVWHFIGRLGCWFGKCQQLVLSVYQFPQLLDGATCEFLALPKEIETPYRPFQSRSQLCLEKNAPGR